MILKHATNILRRDKVQAALHQSQTKKTRNWLVNGCGIVAYGTNTAGHLILYSPSEQAAAEVRDLRTAHVATWPFSFLFKGQTEGSFFLVILALLKRQIINSG